MIWSGQVGSVCISTLQLGGLGGMLPQKIVSETIFGEYNAYQRPDDRVSHVWLPTLSAHCVIQHWFRPSDPLLISQATPFTDEACKTRLIAWKNRKLLEDSEEIFCTATALKRQWVWEAYFGTREANCISNLREGVTTTTFQKHYAFAGDSLTAVQYSHYICKIMVVIAYKQVWPLARC